MVGSLCLKAENPGRRDRVNQRYASPALGLDPAAPIAECRCAIYPAQYLHVLITAKRSHSPVLTRNTIPRSTNRKLTTLKLTSNIRRVIRQKLPINPPSIIDDKTLFGVDNLTNASHRSECALTVP